MLNYSIIETSPTEHNFSLFEKVLNRIYSNEQLPLKQTEGINHEFLYKAYIINENNQPIGRCCLYNNPSLSYHDKKTASLGNFECINNSIASKTLLNYVFKQAKELGFEYIIGPMNGSTWDTYRLAENYNSPTFFLEPSYQNYYTELLTNSGFEKIARYVSNIDEKKETNESRIAHIEKRLLEQGVKFRNIDLENYEVELDKLYEFCMKSFRGNFLFTPVEKSTFKEKYKKVKPYIKPEYVILAEDKNGEMIGAIFCLENYNDQKEKGIIIKTLARTPLLKYGGLGNVLVTQFKKRAMADGYSYVIHAFMIESNSSKVLSNHFSGKTIREYFLYGKSIMS